MNDSETLGQRFAGYATAIPSSPTFPPTSGNREPSIATSKPGIERLQANLQGGVPPPPAWYAIGFRLVAVARGSVEFAFQPLVAHTNYGGTVHGGVLSALADSAMGCAILSDLDGDHWLATVDMVTNFLRPVRVPGPVVVANGRVRKRGRTTAFAEASLLVGETEVVFATSTYAIHPHRHLPGEPLLDQ